MDTLLILRDTVTVDVVKVIDAYSPRVQEAQTNWADVQIVFLICSTIVLSILIISVTMGIFTWRHNSKTRECDEQNGKCVKHDDSLQETNGSDEIINLKEKVDNLSKANKQKEEYEITCEVLDKISSLARPKDGITDKELANELFSLYKRIKSDIHEKTGKTSSEG